MPTDSPLATEDCHATHESHDYTIGGDKGIFTRFAEAASLACGSSPAFLLAVATIVVWAVTGPMFKFSETWQLVINTGTTIVTFLMVFLIQNTQNRDSQAMHLKLDELIRCTDGAHTILLDMEELDQRQLQALRAKYCQIAARGRDRLARGKTDTTVPDIDFTPGLK